MDQTIWKFGLGAFVTLLLVVDPPGVVPTFFLCTWGRE
jgi:small neutral amino acid transporter SnatA (MarC family)